MIQTCLGIDPGTSKQNPCAWAIVTADGVLLDCDICKPPTTDQKRLDQILKILDWARACDCVHMTIESQHVACRTTFSNGKKKLMHLVEPALVLAGYSGWWKALATLQGFTYMVCAPSEWRGVVLGSEAVNAKRDVCKAAALAYVKTKYGLTVPVDAAEAACIGAWGILEEWE